MRRWVFAALGLVALVILLSGRDPWRYTVEGLVAPPDLAQDVAAARVFASDRNPYEVGIARAHADLLNVSEDKGYTHFPHPPLLFLLMLPIADFTLRHSAVLWFSLSLSLLFLLAVILAEAQPHLSRGTHHPKPATVLAFYVALLAWPPVLYNLGKGQWSILVALLLALSWHFYARGQHRIAGAYVGLASAVKLFPALLALYLLLRAPRAAIWMTALVIAAVAVPLVWMGPNTVQAFMHQSQSNVAYWETFPAVTNSLHGAIARVMVGGQWARPLVHAPVMARVLGVLSALVLIMVVTKATRRHSAADGYEGARFAAWTALLVMLNPLAMAHTGVILALPIVLVARALCSDQRIWPKLAWTAGVVLVSISGHTLISLASDPIEPWQGLAVIGLPLWGTLSLFSAAIAVSSPRRGTLAFLSRHCDNDGRPNAASPIDRSSAMGSTGSTRRRSA